MMSEGDALATQLLGQIEEGLPSSPRTEETRRAARVAVGRHLARLEIEIGPLLARKILQVGRITAVIYSLHTHMQGGKPKGLRSVATSKVELSPDIGKLEYVGNFVPEDAEC